MTTLTWLHLSDFHFKPAPKSGGRGPSWRQDRVMDALARDLPKCLRGSGLTPDLVFVTGDVADFGKSAEYRAAQAFFGNLSQTLGLDPKVHWFVVPGNHDVDRAKVKGLAKGLRKQLEAEAYAKELLEEKETWRDFAKRQSAYFRFTREFLGDNRAWNPGEPWKTEIIDHGDYQIAILGLNTAWASQDDDDIHKIMLGERQVYEALKDAEGADLKIALMHHPLKDLAEFDEVACGKMLRSPQGCQFILHGHLHRANLERVQNPSAARLELAAGACWDKEEHARNPFAFGAVKLDLKTGKGKVYVWQYSDNDGGHWVPDYTLYQNMPEGEWAFTLAQASTLKDGEPESPPFDGELIPQEYREWLEAQFGALEPLTVESDAPSSFRLREVYQPLATDWLELEKRRKKRGKKGEETEAVAEGQRARRPLADLLTLPDHRCFIVKGGPGSGKTTFLHRAALAELDRDGGRLPLVLPLQKFGEWLADHKGEDGALVAQWAGNCLGKCALNETALKQRRGRGVLWLLDGLDEIFDTGLRLRAAQAIGEWARGLEGADRLMATARPHALDQPGVRKALGMGETEARVAALDRKAQAEFLDKWFRALYGPEQDDKAKEIKDGLWAAMDRHERIQELRDTPLLLSMLAAVYASGKKLPERRAALYEVAVWNLLLRRYGPGAGGGEAKARTMRRGLMAVARGMIEKGHVREIGVLEFVDLLAKGLGGDRDRSDLEELAEDLGGRSGLLSMKGSPVRYAFSHLGFQEYLAARAYGEDENRMRVLGPKLDDGAWKEVIQLTAGYLCESGPAYIGEGFVKALKEKYEEGLLKPGRLALAIEAAAEAPKAVLSAELIEELKTLALERITSLENPPEEKERAVLGLALGGLGDPRLGMAKAERWVRFEPGGFTMGSKTHGNDANRPEHRVKLSRGYWLGRYPVTNLEYRAFVEAGGYGQREWWSEEGWEWLNLEAKDWNAWLKRQGLPKEFEEYYKPGAEPKYWRDSQFNGANQPVVGVNWHEAEAYCRWLTARLEAKGPEWWPEGGLVRLPSEAEWEYAAQGGTGRAYPWGDEKPEGQRANYGQRLDQPSAVGIYPAGATVEGLWDMAGNVSEWCADLWNEKAYQGRKGVTRDPLAKGDPMERAVRGGSLVDTAVWLPAAYRDWSGSWDRSTDVGFRVLCAAVAAEHD